MITEVGFDEVNRGLDEARVGLGKQESLVALHLEIEGADVRIGDDGGIGVSPDHEGGRILRCRRRQGKLGLSIYVLDVREAKTDDARVAASRDHFAEALADLFGHPVGLERHERVVFVQGEILWDEPTRLGCPADSEGAG